MDVETVMELLSQCQLGALLLDKDHRILAINNTGRKLLFPENISGKPAGNSSFTPVTTGSGITESKMYAERKFLPERFLGLCDKSEHPPYVPVTFDRYVIAHPAPDIGPLPTRQQFIVFRDASKEYRLDVMQSVCNHLSEGIVVCDCESRITYINDPAMKMDMVIDENVLGETVANVYHMTDSSAELPLPKTLRTKSPMLNYRQRYATRHGKEVDAMANTWPILKNRQLLGAFNILEDWSSVSQLHKKIIDLQEKLMNQDAAHPAKSSFTTRYTFDDIIYVSEKMQDIIAQCRQVAKADSAVMIYGETGTGKELFAQSIHHASRRADRPFLAINCAALPENLLESLLFGSVKGAYTGAENRTGLFEQANHGTLLLDEINSMNISLQAKLLRVLQEGTIRKLGGSTEIKVDVRVLSCINIPPQQAIAEGKLRQDLFYRLGVVNINIPPLRDRKEDIPYLVKHFIREYNRKLLTDVQGISPSVLEIFRRYRWPGNVRELQHAIEHALNILPDNASLITPKYIPQTLTEDYASETAWENTPQRQTAASSSAPAASHTFTERPENPAANSSSSSPSLGNVLHDVEREAILKALEANGGNITRTARALNLSRQNLQYRLKRYGIDAAKFRKK